MAEAAMTCRGCLIRNGIIAAIVAAGLTVMALRTADIVGATLQQIEEGHANG